jgi:hypothetical protein
MPDRQLAALLALASRERWGDLQNALARPENRAALPGAMAEFEERGDRAMESQSWRTAWHYYEAVFACASICLFLPSDAAAPEAVESPFDRLKPKLAEASRQVDLEQQAALAAPPPAPPPRQPLQEPVIETGDLFERLADLALKKSTAEWYRLLHDRQYKHLSVYRRMAAHFEALGDERVKSGNGLRRWRFTMWPLSRSSK